jgi:hypothetical protein
MEDLYECLNGTMTSPWLALAVLLEFAVLLAFSFSCLFHLSSDRHGLILEGLGCQTISFFAQLMDHE